MTTCVAYTPVTSAIAATASQRRPITRSGRIRLSHTAVATSSRGPPRSLPRVRRHRNTPITVDLPRVAHVHFSDPSDNRPDYVLGFGKNRLKIFLITHDPQLI